MLDKLGYLLLQQTQISPHSLGRRYILGGGGTPPEYGIQLDVSFPHTLHTHTYTHTTQTHLIHHTHIPHAHTHTHIPHAHTYTVLYTLTSELAESGQVSPRARY